MKPDRGAAFDEAYNTFQFRILQRIIFNNQDYNAPGLLDVVQDRVQYLEDLIKSARRPSDRLRNILGNELSLPSELHYRHGRLEEAGKTQQRQLEIFRAVNDERNLAIALSNLGNTLDDLFKFEEACNVLQQALVLKERIHGLDSKQVVETLNTVSIVQFKLSQLQQARTTSERALRIMETHFYEEDPYLYSVVLCTNAQVLFSIGGEANLNRAMNQVNQAIAIQIRQFGVAEGATTRLLARIEEKQRRK